MNIEFLQEVIKHAKRPISAIATVEGEKGMTRFRFSRDVIELRTKDGYFRFARQPTVKPSSLGGVPSFWGLIKMDFLENDDSERLDLYRLFDPVLLLEAISKRPEDISMKVEGRNKVILHGTYDVTDLDIPSSMQVFLISQGQRKRSITITLRGNKISRIIQSDIPPILNKVITRYHYPIAFTPTKMRRKAFRSLSFPSLELPYFPVLGGIVISVILAAYFLVNYLGIDYNPLRDALVTGPILGLGIGLAIVYLLILQVRGKI